MSFYESLRNQLNTERIVLNKKYNSLAQHLRTPLNIIDKVIENSPLFSRISYDEPKRVNFYTTFISDEVLVYVDFHRHYEEDVFNDFINPLLMCLRSAGYNIKDPRRIDMGRSYVYYINIFTYALEDQYYTIRVRCELIDIPDYTIVEEKYTGTRYSLRKET
jgi:hypothetical protein